MPSSKRSLQYAQPYFIRSIGEHSACQSLTRLGFAQTPAGSMERYDEDWLQTILHDHPDILPINELEPGFGRLIPLGRELQTPTGGYIDNVFVTEDGNIVLVECKLWRNPEARRHVISQIIDYAQGISRWKYADLDKAVSASLDGSGNAVGRPILDIVKGHLSSEGELDEAVFVDAIQRNLKLGRVMLLIVGDGIREDAESMVDYLQQHAGFHFSLGLVEIAIWQLPDSGLVVQPRILVRTLNIERAIIRLSSDAISADAIPLDEQTVHAARPMSMTEAVFMDQLQRGYPEVAKGLNSFLELAKDNGIYLDAASKSASLKFDIDDRSFTLGGVRLDGMLTTNSVCWRPSEIGAIQLAHDYLGAVARMINGSVRKTAEPANWYVVKTGTTSPSADEVLSRSDEWMAHISKYQERLRQFHARS